MRNWLLSLNAAITLSTIALLTLLARLTFLDALYVPEIRVMLPEDQSVAIGVTMVVYMVFVGGWIRALLTSAQGNRAGLIVSLIYSLFTAFGGGLITLVALCPNGCAAYPIGNGIVWANLISGLAASAVLVYRLMRLSAR